MQRDRKAIIHSALLDFIKSDEFVYPLANLQRATLRELRKNAEYKNRMVVYGRQMLNSEVFNNTLRKMHPLKPFGSYLYRVRELIVLGIWLSFADHRDLFSRA